MQICGDDCNLNRWGLVQPQSTQMLLLLHNPASALACLLHLGHHGALPGLPCQALWQTRGTRSRASGGLQLFPAL